MNITDPQRIGRYWLFADGAVMPVVSGGDGDEAEEGGGEEAKGDPPKSFNQDDVDRIVKERLARAKTQAPADYDDLKAKAARLDEIEEQSKSEKDKAVDKAAKDADTAARQDERGKANARIVRAEVKAAAGAKLADPGDAVRLLDLDQFKVDDDGEVDAKAVAAAIDDLVKAKPYLAANSGGKGGKGGAPDLGQGRRDGTKLTAREAGMAEAEKRFGKKSTT